MPAASMGAHRRRPKGSKLPVVACPGGDEESVVELHRNHNEEHLRDRAAKTNRDTPVCLRGEASNRTP
jgi:hypothetical protein